MPRRIDLDRLLSNGLVVPTLVRLGIEALGWIVDQGGLGGGRELDGLAWALPLEELWENYVAALIRREAAENGGLVRVGRQRETVFPIEWSDPSHRTLGHLVPDIVVFRGSAVHIVNAKYKAHLAELDEHAWHRFTDDMRDSHRADVHQVLAYSALYSAEEIHASLVYPLRKDTFAALKSRGRDRSTAELVHGLRRVRLELRGVRFGDESSSAF